MIDSRQRQLQRVGQVFGIPDEYECMDPQLQEILRLTLDPEIDALLAAPAAPSRRRTCGQHAGGNSRGGTD